MRTVLEAANWRYPRNNIPLPSPGVGGACLTKDPYILAGVCDDLGVSSALIRAGREINERMPVWLAEKVVAKLQRLGKCVEAAKVFVMGCAFKGVPETSDVRFSTTWEFTTRLRAACPNIWVYDAVARDEDLAAYGFPRCSIAEGFRGADAVVTMNAHPSHAGLELAALAATANQPLVLMDCWGLYEPAELQSANAIECGGVGIY